MCFIQDQKPELLASDTQPCLSSTPIWVPSLARPGCRGLPLEQAECRKLELQLWSTSCQGHRMRTSGTGKAACRTCCKPALGLNSGISGNKKTVHLLFPFCHLACSARTDRAQIGTASNEPLKRCNLQQQGGLFAGMQSGIGAAIEDAAWLCTCPHSRTYHCTSRKNERVLPQSTRGHEAQPTRMQHCLGGRGWEARLQPRMAAWPMRSMCRRVCSAANTQSDIRPPISACADACGSAAPTPDVFAG